MEGAQPAQNADSSGACLLDSKASGPVQHIGGRMNLPAQISVSGATLPQTYQAAQIALQECSQIDECKDWADKAAALASYARQAEDDQLERMAQRIRSRAIRRGSELVKQIEPQRGGDRRSEQYQGAGDHTLISRENAAREAGMSKHQYIQMMRVGNVPEAEFERLVESEKPPTLSQLASLGVKKREPLVDLQGRSADDFNKAMHYVGAFERAARDLEKQNHSSLLPILDDKERARIKAAIKRIDAISDLVATRI